MGGGGKKDIPYLMQDGTPSSYTNTLFYNDLVMQRRKHPRTHSPISRTGKWYPGEQEEIRWLGRHRDAIGLVRG